MGTAKETRPYHVSNSNNSGLLEVILPSVGCYLGTAIMILLPYIFGADYRQVAIVFTLHYVGQLLLLNIRQLPMFLIGTKSVLSLVLLIDNYL